MRFRSVAALPLIALSLAACGSGGGGTGGTIPAGATVIKAVEGIAWDAKEYTGTITDGKATIALQNASSLPHNLHLLDADNVDAGVALDVQGRDDIHSDSFTLKPGTYQVICTIVGHGNMKATLTVG
jgi:plastocyanin